MEAIPFEKMATVRGPPKTPMLPGYGDGKSEDREFDGPDGSSTRTSAGGIVPGKQGNCALQYSV